MGATMLRFSNLGLSVCMAVFSLAVGLGCSGSEQYRKGRELADSGDYDGAITAMREAAAADPGNAQYQMDLADTQMKVAQKHVDTAQQLLAESKATPAREELNAALQYAPSHPVALRLAAEADERMARAKELTAESESNLKSEQWADAVIDAMQAVRADAANGEAQTALASARAAAKAHNVTVNETTAVAAAEPREPAARSTRRTRRARTERPASSPPATPLPAVPQPPPPPAAPAADSFRATLSRDDNRYPKKMETIDGIVVRLDDTDHEPLNADVTISVGRYKLSRKHIRVGMPVYGRGASGRSYRLMIESILPKSETIHFRIEAVSPSAAYREQM